MMEPREETFAGKLNVEIDCECGRKHKAAIHRILIGRGALDHLPEIMREQGKESAYLLADETTWQVAGKRIEEMFQQQSIRTYAHVYHRDGVLEADERAVEEGREAVAQLEERPSVLITVGSGTLNDLGKAVAYAAGCPQWVVGTAPSMDGYASTVAALTKNDIKISEYYDPPAVIIGDTQIMQTAPRSMVLAGIGDMAAKYNAILEWRISHLVNGEYYCAFIADGMLETTDQVMRLALEAPTEGPLPDELLERLMEGLVASGIYMSYTGSSRAASGAEHHLSHFWEMWLQLSGKPPIYHGVKVGVGSIILDKLYREFLSYSIPQQEAKQFLEQFDEEVDRAEIAEVYGKAAPTVLADYDFQRDVRLQRLERLVQLKPKIDEEITRMLPRLDLMKQAMFHTGATVDWRQLPGITAKEVRQAILRGKEIRPQYTILQMALETRFPMDDFVDQVLRDSAELEQRQDIPILQSQETSEEREQIDLEQIEQNLTSLDKMEETDMEDEKVTAAAVEIQEEIVAETVKTVEAVQPEEEKKPAAAKRRGRPKKEEGEAKPKAAAKKPTAKKAPSTKNAASASPAKKKAVEKAAPKKVDPAARRKKQELPYYLL